MALTSDPRARRASTPRSCLQVAVIKGFVHHNLTDLWTESKKGFIYRIYPGINFLITQYIMMSLLNLFKSVTTPQDPAYGSRPSRTCLSTSVPEWTLSKSKVSS